MRFQPAASGDRPRQGPLENITLEDAAGFDLPVLLVRGANSNILAPDAAERFAAALPRGRLVTVADCGHNVHGQNTMGFIAALGRFLDSLRGTSVQPCTD